MKCAQVRSYVLSKMLAFVLPSVAFSKNTTMDHSSTCIPPGIPPSLAQKSGILAWITLMDTKT